MLQGLDRQFAIQRFLTRNVHDPHAAFRQLLNDLKVGVGLQRKRQVPGNRPRRIVISSLKSCFSCDRQI